MSELICKVCGIKGPPTKYCKEAIDWDWFTGHLPETVHFCPEHKNSVERHELFRLRLIEPNTNIEIWKECGQVKR